jgi:membrane protease YdiL (CAAX protease family)
VILAAAPRRAALLTVATLLAATIRGLLLPAGELPAAVAFVLAMAAVLMMARSWVTPAEPKWPAPVAVAAGVVTGLVLLLPVMGVGPTGRSLAGFWGWGLLVLVVATLEEAVIRGRLQPAWTAEHGPIAGLLAGAAVFALIHLPRYGLGAMPLDFAVGLALGGLRAVTGRVAPCVLAHVIADWGAWFWI